MTTIDSFKYDVDTAGCWVWAGYCDKNGYGRIYDRTRKCIEWAHRYSFRHYVGEIRPHHEIDHMCQNTRCVNPEHLQQLTHTEHMRVTMQRLGKVEAALRGAHLRRLGATYADIAETLGLASRSGAASAVKRAIRDGLVSPDDVPRVKHLTDVEREEIVELVALGVPQGAVAEMYGIHNSQVSRISRGLTSGHGTDAGMGRGA